MRTSQSQFAKCQLTLLLVCLQLAIYGAIHWLSPAFDFHAPKSERPLLAVLGLLLINFGLHLWSLFRLLRNDDSNQLAWRIIGVAIAMRCVMIGSTPIQEIDIFRYMWDGFVTSQGISPFRYPPLVVANTANPPADGNLLWLRQCISHDPGIRETLYRVHYPELPTVYPPTSQFVFAVAAFATKGEADVTERLLVMKLFIVAFDIGVLFCLWGLLRYDGKHSSWLIAYGWSPLVIKEFANSGHLDSFAVFFCIAATCVLVAFPNRRAMLASSLLAGLAVAAKLYPVILFPLWFVYVWRKKGIGDALLFATSASIASGLLLAPMFVDQFSPSSDPIVNASPSTRSPPAWYALDESQRGNDSNNSLSGLGTFLYRWEMNDLIFMLIEENLRPDGHVAGQPDLWFTVIPSRLRIQLFETTSSWIDLEPDRIPFVLARALTLLAFIGLTILLMHRVWSNLSQLPESLFLSLAWFWLLAPTQNPWYWSWALAFIPFATSRAWLAVSGLSMLYYFRFWFQYHVAELDVLRSGYIGTAFFDFVLVWVEFGPLLAGLAITAIRRRIRGSIENNGHAEKSRTGL